MKNTALEVMRFLNNRVNFYKVYVTLKKLDKLNGLSPADRTSDFLTNNKI